jgi:hypothetical protein
MYSNVIRGDGHMNNRGEFVDLPTALFQVTTAVFVAVAAWAALVAVLASWHRTRGMAKALTPRIIRAVIFTTVSGTLAISPARAAGELDGLPYPDRATTGEPALEPAVASSPSHHIVTAGESLWSIATALLPQHADAARVARTSADWYAANRRTIGPDPDLILPGQRLTEPDGEAAR